MKQFTNGIFLSPGNVQMISKPIYSITIFQCWSIRGHIHKFTIRGSDSRFCRFQSSVIIEVQLFEVQSVNHKQVNKLGKREWSGTNVSSGTKLKMCYLIMVKCHPKQQYSILFRETL